RWRRDDRVRDEIAREHPQGFLVARRDAAGDVRQRPPGFTFRAGGDGLTTRREEYAVDLDGREVWRAAERPGRTASVRTAGAWGPRVRGERVVKSRRSRRASDAGRRHRERNERYQTGRVLRLPGWGTGRRERHHGLHRPHGGAARHDDHRRERSQEAAQ